MVPEKRVGPFLDVQPLTGASEQWKWDSVTRPNASPRVETFLACGSQRSHMSGHLLHHLSCDASTASYPDSYPNRCPGPWTEKKQQELGPRVRGWQSNEECSRILPATYKREAWGATSKLAAAPILGVCLSDDPQIRGGFSTVLAFELSCVASHLSMRRSRRSSGYWRCKGGAEM